MTSQTSMPIQALRNSVRLRDPYTLTALNSTTTPLLGLADGDRPVALPESAEHVLVAAGAGGGTTTLLRSLTAQALCLGAAVDVIDPGGTGHAWARDLPGVRYLSRIPEIHDHLQLTVAALQDGTGHWDGSWAGRRILVVEHLGTVTFGLREYWSQTRPETQLEEAPGVEALGVLLAAGPAFGIQVFAANPRVGLPGLGEVPAADVFPTRVLAYGGAALWGRVAPEVWAIPPYSLTPGRMHVVAGQKATGIQALYLSDDEARAFARGVIAPEEAA
ncbi:MULTISPECIES: cell division protein FtsK [unclassified Streptomyces]|uniref:cell division protein FtsK n=1 Tax=unclassified Streptomyces TaxID=2593676 RepID=UPI00225AD405|nr:cell division protein FtsK [Streptomyces sp. NBC_01264]MCX4784081.1 cell division protein FtsK [Streptomyces sp. NBC_01264]